MKTLTPERARLRRVLLLYGAALLLLLGYYAVVRLFHVGIPCLVYRIFGIYCPSCGVSRMCVALLQGDIVGGFLDNPFAFFALPILAVVLLRQTVLYVLRGESILSVIERILLWGLFFASILFGILRNIEAFSFLAP
jgi:hypothetical protein